MIRSVRSIDHRGLAAAITLALALATSAPATSAPAAEAGGMAAGPEWLRAPRDRGPLAAAVGIDERHAWWGIDGALPLTLWPLRTRANVVDRPAFGLGLSIAGSAASDARDLRYAALIDRRGRLAGEWLGISTGGSDGQGSRLRLGTGLWRAVAPLEIEAAVVSGMVGATTREASRWKVVADSLHSRDTVTFRNVDRSGLSTTAQSAVRWSFGRVELSAIGGLTVATRTAPQRWAQATMQLRASSQVLVLAAFGQRPDASMAFEPGARPMTMLGIRLAPWASHDGGAWPRSIVPVARQWRAQPLDDGRTVVRVHCRHAWRVELAADFTDWTPIALWPQGEGWWETSLAIPPGLHRVQVRLNGGAWQVPPGLPRTHQEFAGDAGVLVVD